MVISAGHCLAHELNAHGCPAPRTELARRCGVDHWSQATLDEAIDAAARDGLVRTLPLGWVAPVGWYGPTPGSAHAARSAGTGAATDSAT